MSFNIRSLFPFVIVIALLAGCAVPTPAPIATIPAPSTTATPPKLFPTAKPPPLPTYPAPTFPVVSGIQADIPVKTERFTGTIPATVIGSGDVGIILANSESNDPSEWQPLVETLANNDALRMMTYSYRNVHGSSYDDTRAVFDYLRSQGINKVICMGSYYGAGACADLRTESDIVGMVMFPSPLIPIFTEDFAKLFISGDSDSSGYAGILQQMYERAAEPKVLKIYATGRNGPILFSDPEVGAQAVADVVDFVEAIVNGQ